jgi:hypothetical protein
MFDRIAQWLIGERLTTIYWLTAVSAITLILTIPDNLPIWLIFPVSLGVCVIGWFFNGMWNAFDKSTCLNRVSHCWLDVFILAGIYCSLHGFFAVATALVVYLWISINFFPMVRKQLIR